MLTALIVAALQAAKPQAAAPAEEIPLSLRVNSAIALGVDFLKGLQASDGSYGVHDNQHPGGATALVALTFVRSGVRKNDPALVRALAALEGIEFVSTYSASVHLLLCEALRDPQRRAAAQTSLDFLLDHQEHGVWAYPWGKPDNSNTQFAVLGLRSARRMGLEVPESALIAVLDGLSAFLHPSGGFVYSSGLPEAYAGMTAAALASIAVLQEAAPDHARLRAELEKDEKKIKEAEHWLELRFDAGRNIYSDDGWRSAFQHAYLWAVERWCGLTGRERIAKHDWYKEGAEWLLANQGNDGSFARDKELENTCFALLFLRRATMSPVEELDAIYAEIERERAKRPWLAPKPGPAARRLTEWWLAGPWPQTGIEPILIEPPFDPADAKPAARAKIARRDWELFSLHPDEWTDLRKLTEREGKRQLWALATWLHAEKGTAAEPLEARLWFELKDGWDVWLDGKRLTRERRRSLPVTEDVNCELRLTRGNHLLVVLVEDLKGPAAFGARLTSLDNGPPPAELLEDPTPDAKGKGGK